MGILNEAGYNIGVFIMTLLGILAFLIFIGFIVVKIGIPIIQDKLSSFVGGLFWILYY